MRPVIPPATLTSAMQPTSNLPGVLSGKVCCANLHSDDNALNATISENSPRAGCHKRLSFMHG